MGFKYDYRVGRFFTVNRGLLGLPTQEQKFEYLTGLTERLLKAIPVFAFCGTLSSAPSEFFYTPVAQLNDYVPQNSVSSDCLYGVAVTAAVLPKPLEQSLESLEQTRIAVAEYCEYVSETVVNKDGVEQIVVSLLDPVSKQAVRQTSYTVEDYLTVYANVNTHFFETETAFQEYLQTEWHVLYNDWYKKYGKPLIENIFVK